MRVVALNCNNCGAPLEAPRKARFITCGFCNSRLAIKHHGDAAYTEALEEISRDVKQIKQAISASQDLERLDRAWETERTQYMVRDKHGRNHVPNATASIIGGVLAAIFGVFWMTAASGMGAPSIFPLFGLVFIAAAIFGAVNGSRKARAFRSAQQRYFARRHDLSRKQRVED